MTYRRHTTDPNRSATSDSTAGRAPGVDAQGSSPVLLDLEGDGRWVPSYRTESVSPPR